MSAAAREALSVAESGTSSSWMRSFLRWKRKHFTKDKEDLRLIERFFRDHWVRWISSTSYILIAIAVVLTVGSTYFATLLDAPIEAEAFFPEDHPLLKAQDLLRKSFPASSSLFLVRVIMSWGVKDVDRTGTSKYKSSDRGKAVLDSTFDLRSVAAQKHVLDACSFFERQNNLLTKDAAFPAISCWPREFLQWGSATKPEGRFTDYATQKALARDLWAFGNSQKNGVRPYFKYLKSGQIGLSKDKNSLRYMELRFVSNTAKLQPYRVMFKSYERWQKLLTEYNAKSPRPVRNAILTGEEPWMWQITQKRLVDSMFIGIGVMLGVAFVVLTFSTLNVVVSILALLCVAGIVSNLLGLVHLLGWSLGITESIGVVIAIGFSFDYIAHLANAYMESDASTRSDKTRDALTELGISIVAGAVTTMLAGGMLLFAIIIFFQKFGFFVIATVTLSVLWSLVFFSALLAVLGPTGNVGSLKCLMVPIRKFKQMRKDSAGSTGSDGTLKSPENRSGSDVESSEQSRDISGNSMQLQPRSSSITVVHAT